MAAAPIGIVRIAANKPLGSKLGNIIQPDKAVAGNISRQRCTASENSKEPADNSNFRSCRVAYADKTV